MSLEEVRLHWKNRIDWDDLEAVEHWIKKLTGLMFSEKDLKVLKARRLELVFN